MTTRETETTSEGRLFAASRRAYEVARARVSALRGILIGASLGALSACCHPWSALMFLPGAIVVIALAEWRGRDWSAGVRVGTAAGLALWLVPLGCLRPCCALLPVSATSCVVVGVGLGLFLGGIAPRGERGRLRPTVATVLGGLLTAGFRCVSLAPLEIVALVGGVLGGAGVFLVLKSAVERTSRT